MENIIHCIKYWELNGLELNGLVLYHHHPIENIRKALRYISEISMFGRRPLYIFASKVNINLSQSRSMYLHWKVLLLEQPRHCGILSVYIIYLNNL